MTIPAYFFAYDPPKTTFSLCASDDLSASCVGSASQAITMQRADTAKQINFLVSIDSFHQTFGLAPPPQLFGHLSASDAVSRGVVGKVFRFNPASQAFPPSCKA